MFIVLVEVFNLFSPDQFGFCEGNCSTNVIVYSTDGILIYFGRGEHSISEFMDIIKAFDDLAWSI